MYILATRWRTQKLMTIDVNSIDIQHLQTVYKVSGVQPVYIE